MGRPTITASSLLLLTVAALIALTNANLTPEILNNFETLCEDIPKGGFAFQIEATDKEEDPLSYSISGPNAGFFTVAKTNGTVTINNQLDREARDSLVVTIEVSDGKNMATKDLTIILSDANDNAPMFQASSYNVDIKENVPVGKILLTVLAIDPDFGPLGSEKYSIDEVFPIEGKKLFSINDRSGEVKLKHPLNYTSLSTFYRLKIIASDEGGGSCKMNEPQSSFTFSFITVLDVPDLNPRFLSLPYRGSVQEGTELGTPVLTVLALDQDTGVNDIMTYTIEAGSGEPVPFIISEDTGVISVSSAIDRETIGDSITLTVKATEQKPNVYGKDAFATADVQISILDINDNPPKFYSCGSKCVEASEFRGEIQENSAGNLQINMTVKDLDQDGKIKLEVDGVDKDAFAVNPTTATSKSTVQLVVKDPQKLDFEKKKEMVVQVIAIDEEKPTMRSTATVTIKILDLNDNSPTFPKDTYTIDVPEHSPVDTTVATITATDGDAIDKDKLTYRLLPQSILKYFNVTENTGEVYVTNSTLIDREVNSLYSATLQARDTNNLIGTTVLEISLTDINDKPPKINPNSYNVFVEEGKEFRLQIEATDADDPESINSKIVFAIVPTNYSDYFTIDAATGVLINRVELDREALEPTAKGKIELNITATDKGVPALMTSAAVTVNVEDVNDNEPIFTASSYEFSVKEGVKGAFVGSVWASDLDQALDFNRISFTILGGSFGSFIIRTVANGTGYRGDITVDPDVELDYEKEPKEFNLQVEGMDLSGSRAEVEVKIKVLDVNDERPEFKPEGPLEVEENSKDTGSLGSFSAEDKDGTSSLVYQMESCECRCNGTYKPCDWMLVDGKGAVTINPEAKLDYEECDKVKVWAQVVDENTEVGENNSISAAEMVVDIVDVNDNAPEFLISDAVIVLVSETASKGSSVTQVTATDRDSGINKEIEFKVTAVKYEDTNSQIVDFRTIFEAVTTQQKDFYVGIIQPTEELDSSKKGKYLVNVTATDRGGLYARTELKIFIIDKSFKVEVRFGLPKTEVVASRDSITLALSAATKSAVYVTAIIDDPGQFRALGDTLMMAYFVYPNGSALSEQDVNKKFTDPKNHDLLAQYNLENVGKVTVVQEPPNTLQFGLLGLLGGLVIVLIVLTTTLVCTRRSYRTKLKAAKAMKYTNMETTDNQRGGPVVPGTNKYTMEGANPVLNLNIDTVTDLGFDEESSNVERISVNSFDDGMSLHSENDRTMMGTSYI
ncbi:cadherin-related family member 2 isoform X2 [Gadus chalcogrammus]|uniref:cadherin-related family member 2 isoform X2 n=1 Tax=Gadus chalcogrammus TaxID=1042646 RepID=UPI0024C483F6|nr:cadherin-related family member 2 isoform X2 [Gadus chalcogrammus]